MWTLIFFGLTGAFALAVWGIGEVRRRRLRSRQRADAELLLSAAAGGAESEYAPHNDF